MLNSWPFNKVSAVNSVPSLIPADRDGFREPHIEQQPNTPDHSFLIREPLDQTAAGLEG